MFGIVVIWNGDFDLLKMWPRNLSRERVWVTAISCYPLGLHAAESQQEWCKLHKRIRSIYSKGFRPSLYAMTMQWNLSWEHPLSRTRRPETLSAIQKQEQLLVLNNTRQQRPHIHTLPAPRLPSIKNPRLEMRYSPEALRKQRVHCVAPLKP